jgi:hypothetical protein
MGELSDKTVLVYDYGGDLSLALRLAQEFGRVLYYRPWKEDNAVTSNKMVGVGYDQIEVVPDFFEVLNEPDLFVFPHIYDGDLQRDLVNRGKRVWGSRKGDIYELDRLKFKAALKKVGLPVVPYHRCQGMSQLRSYLREQDDKWVKTDMRGDGETWHHTNYAMSSHKLDAMDYFYGPFKEEVTFIVDDSIESIVEAAYDGHFITSPEGQPQWPQIGFEGYEDKNLTHILAACPYSELAEPVRDVNDRFGPLLAQYYYRGPFGTEIKVTDDGHYFIDATCREPCPPGQIIHCMIKNLGKVMYHGAEGELVDYDIDEPVGVQVQLHSNWAGANHEPVMVPKQMEDWVTVEESYRDDDGIRWALTKTPDDPIEGWRRIIGAVVALGKTVEDAIELAVERCKQLESFNTLYQCESLLECLKRIEEGEKEGVRFPVSAPKPKQMIGLL